MEKFDLVFYKGNSFVSKIVRKITKSEYSHVALVLDEYHLLEADWRKPLSIRHISYKTQEYDVFRVEELTEKQKEYIKEFMMDTLNTPYDFTLILAHLLNYFFKVKLFHSPYRYDCSEWIDLAFLYAGVDLLPMTKSSTVTPAELSKSPKITMVNP